MVSADNIAGGVASTPSFRVRHEYETRVCCEADQSFEKIDHCGGHHNRHSDSYVGSVRKIRSILPNKYFGRTHKANRH